MPVKHKLYISQLILFLLPLSVILAFSSIWIKSLNYTLLGLLILSGTLFFIAVSYLILTYLLAESILKPLSMLTTAAHELKNGNLDYSISYEANDEFGRMIKEFDEMRVRFKETIDQNMQYQQEKKELVASIAHDLKTPVTSILGYVEALNDNIAATTEKREYYLHTVFEKAQQINKLVDTLLITSKLDLRSFSFHKKSVGFIRYITELFAEEKYELEEKGAYAELVIDCEESEVLLDTEEFGRVIDNVLQNSFKYSSQKPLRLTFRVYDNKSRIILKITDNGIGINPGEEEIIFERFYRGDHSRGSTEGSGLGLSIARQLLEGFDGKIWARGNESGGLSIYISLEKAESV